MFRPFVTPLRSEDETIKTAVISLTLIAATLFTLAKTTPVTASVGQMAAMCGHALESSLTEATDEPVSAPVAEGMACGAE